MFALDTVSGCGIVCHCEFNRASSAHKARHVDHKFTHQGRVLGDTPALGGATIGVAV